MEVHHHTSAPDKKFTHYIWEFIMLFLAVFCGFLAENQREHMIERQQEKQYIRSLQEDLSRDISQIDSIQFELIQFISVIDSIAADFNDLKEYRPALTTIKQLSGGMGFRDFIYNDRTIQQLKNAGNMRLIRNLAVADSITEYDSRVRRGKVHQDLVNEIYLPKIKDKIKYIINTTLMNKLTTADLDEAGINSLMQNILLTHDKTELIRFVNEMNEYRSQIRYQLGFVTHDKEEAQRLLTLIKKEYRLN